MATREPDRYLIIGRKEFLDKFKWEVPGIAEIDIRETLTQVVDVLSNQGRVELLLMNSQYAILDLNRMVESKASMSPEREVQWQRAAHQLALDFIHYLEQAQMFDENHWFHYLLINLTPTAIIFEYFPF